MIEKSQLAHKVSKYAHEYTIDQALKEGDLSFYLPVQWAGASGGDGIGGKCVKDPLTIYASWDVNGCDERVTFKTTLKALLEDTFDLMAPWDGGPFDSESLEIFIRIRKALLIELDRVDLRIKKGTKR
jgi:hypothetical protein